LADFLARHHIAADELTPALVAAITDLLGDIAFLSGELEKERIRAQYAERLADEDALMPVANRRAFMRELERMLALAQRYGTESSVVYIDLNGMKTINDLHGHAAGDLALQHVARILVENVRQADVVARLGGDEFAVLLVQTDQPSADAKAQSLARAVKDNPLVWEASVIRLSASFGAYCFHGEETALQVIEAADAKMYRDKEEARRAGLSRG
jgi:diguanylate cyclase (GGDEF)-like protein